jgi:hypothetical protein
MISAAESGRLQSSLLGRIIADFRAKLLADSISEMFVTVEGETGHQLPPGLLPVLGESSFPILVGIVG